MHSSSPKTSAAMCFIYRLLPGREADYDRYHAEVWPEVIEEIRASGITDYDIYRRGTLVISVMTRDHDGPTREVPPAVAAKVDEWHALMAPLFEESADEYGQPLYAQRIFALSEAAPA